MKKAIFALLTVFLLSGVLSAQDNGIDEDALFSETESVVTNMNSNFTSLMDKQELVFSGNILNRENYSLKRSWFMGDTPGDTNTFGASLSGNFNLDLRLRQGFKAHLNMYVSYSTTKNPYLDTLINSFGPLSNQVQGLLDIISGDTSLTFPEFFVDMNISQKVYFRIGKQVIKWGTANLWNPTDLINLDRTSFLDSFQVKRGVPGLKMHIPFGTTVNIYTFLDVSGAKVIKDTAIAGKFEVLLGRTEVGLSAWAKQDNYPVYGLDFTSRIGQINIYGEVSLSEGENRLKIGDPVITGPQINYITVPNTNIFIPIVIGPVTNYSTTQATNGFIPRITLGFSRIFNYIYDNRVTIGGEFYYNSSGYMGNIFADPIKANWMIKNGLYRPYDTSQFYGALFTTINHFFDSTLSFTGNILGNFNDLSFVVATTLTYQPIFNFSLGLTIDAFLGPDKAEFTYGDQGALVEVTANYTF